MKRRLAAMALALTLLGGAALAETLPEDVPVQYPPLEMAQDAVANEAAGEAQPSAEPQPAASQPAEPQPSAAPIRPGDRPGGNRNSITIQTISDISFPSPLLPGQVNVGNPQDSTVNVQYMLRISAAELERQTGRTGYSPEQLSQLEAQGDYDPESSYIVLSQTQGIAPGQMVETMTLGTLPDGSTVPAGDYQAEMVMAAYDRKTNRRSMVGAVVKVQFHVLSDQITVTFDESGLGQLGAYNPVTAQGDVIFSLQLSQKAVEDGCGQAHVAQEQLAQQQADPAFDPAYEFLTIYESEPVAPGSFIQGDVQLMPLPDGTLLPPGEYEAWLVRYAYDAQWNSWQQTEATTQVTLVVTGKAGDTPG